MSFFRHTRHERRKSLGFSRIFPASLTCAGQAIFLCVRLIRELDVSGLAGAAPRLLPAPAWGTMLDRVRQSATM